MPTGIWSSRLRSGSAHCDLELAVEVRHCDLQLAVEVRQCPLGSGARGGGPAVPTGIWTARREAAGEEAEEEENSSDKIYSNNPHLAGGEKTIQNVAVRKRIS